MTSGDMDTSAPVAVDYDPFAETALARVVPATEPQREIWLAAKLEPAASLAYNESVSFRFRGALDAGRLRHALQAIVDRHEALRGTFGPDGSELMIAERAELAFATRDLSALDASARDAEIAATLRRVVETPFDLEKGPLIRAELLRFGAEDHLLVITAHHIVCDGWSWGVIAADLAALYRNDGAALAAADPFGDYAIAEAAATDSEEHRADEAYWLARFAGRAPALDLPTDRPRPRQRTFASLREDRVLDADLVSRLKSAGAKQKASLYAVLLAGFGALLSRLDGEDDLVIGLPAAGQAAGGHHGLVGHCVNVLPLRVAVDAATPFANLLDRVRTDLLDAFDHQRYTLGTLLKRLALPRDAGRLPLCSVLFNLDQALDESTVDFAGLSFDFYGNPRTFENFELFINAVQTNGALRLECQYNRDLFDASTVRRWLDAYETLLRAALADPAAHVGALPLASPAELETLRAWQPRPTPFPRDKKISDLVYEQAARTPERVALSAGETAWTYAELAAQAHAIAHALRARGVGAGDLVGVSLTRRASMLATVLGVLEAGAAYVPLDPAFPRERLAFMAEDAKLALLVTEESLAGTLEWPSEKTLLVDEIGPDADRSPLAPSPFDAESPAYVIYTSGSTGKPKGVRVPHRAVVNFLLSMQREPGLAADDRLLAVTTLSFDISVLELFLPLTVGAEVVLASREQAVDGHALIDLLASSGATSMQATPATWRLLIEGGWKGGPRFKALCGGEALPVDLARLLLERTGELWNMYGPTETTVWSTCWRVEETTHGIPIGRPIANTTVWILDAARNACPVGVPGEIAIGGDGVTLGYLDRPELTADRFVADPFADRPGALLYRTGDRGRWRDDGTLEHLGRLDFQVKVRGYRIELGEIETALMANDSVARAVVIVREDRAGDARLVAYLTAAPGATIDEAELRRRLRASLPDYMLPQHFVVLAAIPLLPNGKIDRRALPAPGAAAAASTPATSHVAPRSDLERRIATAMEETLALPDIGIHDDFFAIGGHSLLAAQLTARLNRELGASLSLRSLFDTPTIAGLAETLAAKPDSAATDASRVGAREDQRYAPLSLLQKRLWLFEQLNPGSVVYNTPSAHRLRGAMDETAFTRAFEELVARQASLRTSITYLGEEVVQEVHDAIPLALFPAEDLSGLAPAEREAELARRLDALTNQPFDLTRAPLFRVRVFRLAPDDHVLFFMPHHIVWDGWSFDLFYEEFSALYSAFKEGKPSPLAPLPVSYGDFAVWHGAWLESEEYAGQFRSKLAWWRERLATHGAPPPLPTDKPRRPGMAGTGDTEWLRVPSETTEAMRAVGQQANATLFMTLLAAYYALLYRVVGDGNLVVGTPVRVRRSTDTEHVMGLFTNLLPLPIDVDASMSFLDLVARVKDVVLEGFASPEIQLEDLMREPGMREAAGATHFYQAQFSYQDARHRITEWGGLSHEHLPLFQRGASEDLAVWFLEHRAGMIGGVLYNADILSTATARRLAADYLALLDRAIANPAQSIASLAGVGADTTESMRTWNMTSRDLPAGNIVEMIEAALERAPQKNALTFGSWGTTSLEIEQRSNRIAACLRTRGVAPGSRVGFAMEHGPNRIAALLGLLKCGATGLPLDPTHPHERIRNLLDDAGATALIADSQLVTATGWPRERALCPDADTSELISAPSARVPVSVDTDAPALIVYPHADAAAPLGLGLTHRGIVNLVAGLQAALAPRDDAKILGIASSATPAAALETLFALATGVEIVQASRAESADGAALAHWLGDRAEGALFATPATLAALIDAGWSGSAGVDVVSTDVLDSSLVASLEARTKSLSIAFGVPEATMVSTFGEADADASGVVGRPIANVGVWVLDADGQVCPPGMTGEIHISGAGVALAAGQRAESTPSRFVAVPAALREIAGDGVGDRLAATGRRGRWREDGRLELFAAAERADRAPASPATTAAPARAALSPRETWLIEIWKEALGVDAIEPEDNFFDLGGHSLLAMTMVAKVEKRTRVRLNLLKVANGTVRALAMELPETIPDADSDPEPVSLAQRVRGLFGFGKSRGTGE